jgi:hypothetical protein
MAFSVSPSVIVREIDASAVIPAAATPPAAVAGVFRWGPVNEAILVTSEDNLVARFGKPTDDNYETFFTAADFLAYSNALYVVRAHDATANSIAESTNFKAKYPGELGNSLEVSHVTPGDYQEDIAAVGDLLGTITFNSNTITFSATTASGVANTIADSFTVNDVLRIGNDSVGYQELFVSNVGSATVDGANTQVAISFTNKYTLSELDLADLKVERKWRYSSLFGAAPTAGHLHIIVKDEAGAITGVAGTILETYPNVSTTAGAKLTDGTANYYKAVLENRSAWIEAQTATIDASIAATGYESLSGGADSSSESTIGLGALATAYDLFADPKELDIAFVLQGKGTTTMSGGLPTHANLANYIVSNIIDNRRDCVAFLSPPKEAVVDLAAPNSKVNAAIAYRNQVQSSSYWFMDSGYKYRYDKYNDVYRWVPLNGDIAGLASRTESWESPAGYRRGIIKNVVKLAFNPNKTQRDLLYGSNINPVISITGQGILLFGDKTGQGFASAFDRINVRRLFITVEKAIATAAEQFLFEFNDEFTRTQFKNIVEPFLRDIQGRRGIIDFRVISDETVNTPDVIDQNIFRANIFIKPARSINVIELTFVATRTGVEFDEIVGQIT